MAKLNELVQFGKYLNKGIIEKNFLEASRLWVGRRYDPIIDHVSKLDEK